MSVGDVAKDNGALCRADDCGKRLSKGRRRGCLGAPAIQDGGRCKACSIESGHVVSPLLGRFIAQLKSVIKQKYSTTKIVMAQLLVRGACLCVCLKHGHEFCAVGRRNPAPNRLYAVWRRRRALWIGGFAGKSLNEGFKHWLRISGVAAL